METLVSPHLDLITTTWAGGKKFAVFEGCRSLERVI